MSPWWASSTSTSGTELVAAGGEEAGGSVAPAMPAGEIVGLLADGDRLRAVAALVLGATTMEEVVAASGLDVRRR